METSLHLEDLWAKTSQDGHPALTVANHCLDVGAVARFVCESLPPSCRHLPPSGTVTLIACHDIGKITPGFQMKSPYWREKWQRSLSLQGPDQYEGRHAIVSQAFLASISRSSGLWLLSVGAHHGNSYTTHIAPLKPPYEGTQPWTRTQKEELLAILIDRFGPLPSETVSRSARLHWMTGLTIFCDWIGSNTEWFPLSDETAPRANEAVEQMAKRALSSIGWQCREAAKDLSFSNLFQAPGAAESSMMPRPLQQALLDCIHSPGLYILEAPMGQGKTEAALAAAYQRWNTGDERGIYFALPTQLTSNRIQERVGRFLANSLSSPASFALAHGNAWLNDKRISTIFPTVPGLDEGAATANLWFSDSRKALLAPFGVGTIDQALLSVVPARHSALRLFALGGKVIVLDEIHSYDPYTSALVDRLVKWLLPLGCTIIILSATLTRTRRAEIVAAAGAEESQPSDGYPLITKVITGSNIAETIEIPDTSQASLVISVQHVSAASEDWLSQAVSAAESGACVLIVRNTIAQAQDTYRDAKSRCRDIGVRFGLLHSRFPQFQRDRNESEWMELLGPGEGSRPKGAILVGTQVVEQSVDIDADLLITDLAPTDLLLQRIGRLHRHARLRPPGYEVARCLILHPSVDWETDKATVKKSLGASGYIYPPFRLFQAQRTWLGRSSLRLPTEIREVLEASASIEGPLPAGAEDLRQDLLREMDEMKLSAAMADVFRASTLIDEEGVQTRWNLRPSGFVVLLRSNPVRVENRLRLEFLDGSHHEFLPGLFDFALARSLHQNAVRLSKHVIADLVGSAPAWLAQHFPQSILAVCQGESTACELPYAPEFPGYALSYHSETGLSFAKNFSSERPSLSEEPDWF